MTTDLQETAITLVAQYAQGQNPEKTIGAYDFQVISFHQARFNWEAVVVKKEPNGMRYRVVYDGYSAELHLHVYAHVTSMVIPEKRN